MTVHMNNLKQRISAIPWESRTGDINRHGYTLVEGFLDQQECQDLIKIYEEENRFRKTVVMERHRFGKGEYKYFSYPLPVNLQSIRENIYPYLVPLANQWMQELNIEEKFPADHADMIRLCRDRGQEKSTLLILKYGAGGFNTLHQDLYGEIFFPFQVVLFLNEPGIDYAGGSFVMIEQVPRAQSKAIVIQPRRGDMLIFTTNFRPVKGSRGYYRAAMKHGVSEINSGSRHTLGIIFHDAGS
jgi:uncharacterized protein